MRTPVKRKWVKDGIKNKAGFKN